MLAGYLFSLDLKRLLTRFVTVGDPVNLAFLWLTCWCPHETVGPLRPARTYIVRLETWYCPRLLAGFVSWDERTG